ncbi:WS/DGAT/MGAT family O-acyltransferase [Parasphingorhabdus halotolerans]|uniref:diacylglycerol O-acyltransferase n=1 Tax=Parasphingorhabdus halotolerans TaxID=2725558 RepID=A0A6H2DMN4_9SPHN|nr:wax ester/triacylglycerol synthase family O-acyltransferase [Parasphingorhabdus halotolerans]QJB69932.1 wax ester/triacylglycerol synthase family O-acyltransferase [Parasphingorhabdus halotolerans]
MEQLSTLDALFAYTETQSTPMHIGQMLIYDPSTAPATNGGKKGAVGFKDILRYIEGRLDGARIFRQKLVRVPLDLDHPYWVDDADFDLEYHVRHIALPQPGDWRQLCIQAARIYARPLDMKRPLWEFTVIEGLNNVDGVPPGSFAVLHKFHHAAMDGKSGLEMTLALHDMDAKMAPREFEGNYRPEPDPAPLNLLFKAQINNVVNPVRGLKTLQNLLPVPKRMFDLTRRMKQRDDAKGRAPKTRFNKKISPHRVFDGREFSLADIKKIRINFPGATVNDVMIALVGGSLRAYLKAKNDLPEKTLKIGAPVSVRSDDDKASAGNQVTMMQVGAGTHLDSAAERLEFVMAETQRSKAMTEAMGAKTLMEISGAMPAGLTAASTKLMVRMGLVENMNPAVNTVVTNVPGPMVPMYFAGAKLVKSFGMGILAEGQGVFHVVTSYNGNVILTFLADREIMPDPEFYAACVEQSFMDLMKAKSTKAVKPVKKVAPKKKSVAVKKAEATKPKKRVAASAATAGRGRAKRAKK